jgi:hypothetical protein
MKLLDLIQEVAFNTNDPDRYGKVTDIGNAMEFGYESQLSQQELIQGIELLIAASLSEKDDYTRENILYAVSQAITYHEVAEDVDWNTLQKNISTFSDNELEYVIYFLGHSRRRKYLPDINKYLTHPNERIFIAAQEAVKEMHDYYL